MPDHSLHAEGDPAARVEAARSEMIASATEAWEAIRAMEPSAERVDLERSFAEQARSSLKLAPDSVLLAEHAQVADRNTDPYHNPTLASLARLDGLARQKWRAPTEEPGGVLWETGTDRRRNFGVKLCGWH